MTTNTTALEEETTIKFTDKLIGFSVLFIIGFLLIFSLSDLFIFASSRINQVNQRFSTERQIFQQINDVLKQNIGKDMDSSIR